MRTRLLQAIAAVVPLDGAPPGDARAAVARLSTLPVGWAAEAAAWRDLLALPLETALGWLDRVLEARLSEGSGHLLGLRRQLGPGGLVAHADRIAARGLALDPVFTRHARYLVLHHPPTAAPDPVSWLQDWLLHAAVVRALSLALPGEPDRDRVVDVAWRYAREIEHRRRGLDPAAPAVEPATLRTVGALALLIAP